MFNINKILVKREARRILCKIEQLDDSQDIIDELANWRRTALNLIKEVYGADSDLFTNLQKIQVEKPIAVDSDGEPFEYSDPIQLGRDLKVRVEWVVKDFLQSVEKSGLPFGYRAPRSKWLLSHLLTFLVTGVVAFGAMYYGFKLNQSAQPREERYKVTEVEFNHWYRNLFMQHRNGQDSIRDEVIRTTPHGVWHSVGLRKLLEYAEDFERQTDKTLDSFLMEYAVQGGDTLTLHYKRKPLGNLSQKLRNSRAFKR